MKRQLSFTTKQLRSRPNRLPRHHYSNLKFQPADSSQLSSISTIASVNNNNNQIRNVVVAKTHSQKIEHQSLSEYSCVESVNNGQLLNSKSSLIVKEPESSSDVVSEAEYTPSIWCDDSGSEFSVGDESFSDTFQLFCLFKQNFCRSNFTSTVCPADDDDDGDECYPLLGLEDEVEEESYRMIRKRERRQVYLHDYAEAYCTTDYGELLIQQRLRMVHWIVEQATKKKLQMETMFLGVNLLDRFLSLGYFRNKDDLQLAGIACLTLATRIEERQPYNCVQTETFCVGNATYYRSEVVGMEWLVMEVLNFKCFLPTLYNFLWYYLKAARASKKLEKTAKYLGVLALTGHQQLCFWPSTVAAALVILASIATSENASCHLITAIHARETDESLPECVKSMEWLVKYL